MGMALGIDTGGTCTDAVLLDAGSQVIASAKALTSHGRLVDGLTSAVRTVVQGQDVSRITLVSVSTTLATNALVEGRGRPVGLVLIGFAPERLDKARLGEALAGDPVLFVGGGHRADGGESAPLDLAALQRDVVAIDPVVEAWAVCSMFAVRNPAHELAAAEALRQLTGKPVSTGHRLSASLDAPRRALTALLNARLVPAIVELLDATDAMLSDAGIRAPLMVVKGDGTLIAASLARELPVETILSGPAASVIGARFLAAVEDCVVVDIGGTTSDIALLCGGRPRLSPHGATVGGWPTMVEAIDVASVGLGGDSEVGLATDAATARPSIGPRRVMPLSLFATRNDSVLTRLQRELDRGHATTHDGNFVVLRPGQIDDSEGAVAGLARSGKAAGRSTTAMQRELLRRVRSGTCALGELFADGSSLLALQRLERNALVLRAAFTPTDACHVLGFQSHWDTRAAWLGARLAVRQCDGDWRDDAVVKAFCKRVADEVSRLGAVAIARALFGLDRHDAGDGYARRRWLDELIGASADPAPVLSLRPALAVPVLGLGASAPAFHPRTAAFLGSRALLPEHGEVANAIGAVVGVVRQEVAITLLAAGRDSVRVLLPAGPETFDSLPEAVEAATAVARHDALQAATLAGARDVTIDIDRDDTVVERDGERVFLQCVIRASAVGRPRSMIL